MSIFCLKQLLSRWSYIESRFAVNLVINRVVLPPGSLFGSTCRRLASEDVPILGSLLSRSVLCHRDQGSRFLSATIERVSWLSRPFSSGREPYDPSSIVAPWRTVTAGHSVGMATHRINPPIVFRVLELTSGEYSQKVPFAWDQTLTRATIDPWYGVYDSSNCWGLTWPLFT